MKHHLQQHFHAPTLIVLNDQKWKKMKVQVFHLKVSSVIFRCYLMIATVAILVFLNQIALAAICGFIIALSAILGVSFSRSAKEVASIEHKVVPMKPHKPIKRAV